VAEPTATDTKLEKAYLTITPVTADGANAGAAKTLALCFNPTEYRVAKSAAWARTSARSALHAGPLQWRGTQPSRMTLTAFLDESDSASGSVLADAEALLACCAPTPESLQRNEPSAPYVAFGWGTTTGFTGVMHEVDVSFTLFRNDGQPCRATVTLTIEEVDVAPARQNPTSGARSVTRTHVVTAGDRLPLVAYRMYGDATLWRLIADANRIEDPLSLRTGETLLVPARHADLGEPA
jgi:nucleoid-associated protein YgaU